LITFGGGSAKKSDLIEKVKASLGNRTVVEFGGIEPNPRYETLMKAAENISISFLPLVVAP
jgi:NADP-dependent alcohol dehydrogenase